MLVDIVVDIHTNEKDLAHVGQIFLISMNISDYKLTLVGIAIHIYRLLILQC